MHRKHWLQYYCWCRAPSKLNITDDVPTTPTTVNPAVPTTPMPRMPTHTTDVAAVQLLVAQLARAMLAVCVASAGAKPMPVSVTLAAADATLYGEPAVRTGAVEKRIKEKNKCIENIGCNINVGAAHRQS